MTQHTIVAVYETVAQAAAAVSDLRAANILPDAISQHTKTFSLPIPAPQRRRANKGSGQVCSAASRIMTRLCTTAASRAVRRC